MPDGCVTNSQSRRRSMNSFRRIRLALLSSLAIASLVGTSGAAQAAPRDAQSAAAAHTVSIDNFAFSPPDVTIPVGTTLTWTNTQDGVQHATTSGDGVWDSGVLSTTGSFEMT